MYKKIACSSLASYCCRGNHGCEFTECHDDSVTLARSGKEGMNDWCDQEDWVPDGERVYRCTKCGKRLYPRGRQEQGEFLGWQLPPHKTKGHRIRAIKARQHRIRRGQK